MGTDDDVTIDFVEGFSENGQEHTALSQQLQKDQVRFYTDVEAHAELRAKYGGAEISRRDIFDDEIDRVIQKSDDIKKLESDQKDKRLLYPGMVFVIRNSDRNECETFQIDDIIEGENGEPGMIRLWD